MAPLMLSTERAEVTLREYQIADAREIFGLIDRNRAHLSMWGDPTAGKYATIEDVEKSIAYPLSAGRLRMGIWYRDEFAGSINMQPCRAPYYGEIGYWLGKEFTGLRIMSASARALVEYGFETYYYLTANTRVENLESQRVLERVGFHRISQGDVYYNYRLGAHEWRR